MNDKFAGAFLLGMAGLIVAIGAMGSQIADAIVLGQFYVSKTSGYVPTGPENAGLHLSIIIAAVVLSLTGIFLLFRKPR